MKPSQIADSLAVLIQANQPTFVHGSPGVGKSDTVRQVAQRLDMPVYDVRTVLLDPVDLRGLPHLNGDGRTKWAPPVFLPEKGPGIIFLDELTSAPPLVQAACYQLVLDRRLGEYVVPDGVRILAAGNKQTDRAVVHRMSSALANRFTHLEYEVDFEDWRLWANKKSINELVIGFLKFRLELLFKFDPDHHAWPSPRSWEKVSNILRVQPPEYLEHGLIAGTVGTGAAVEFVAAMKLYRKLPSVEEILANPEKAPVPDRKETSICYAVSSAVSRAATVKNIDRVTAYLKRLQPEFSVLTIHDATIRDKDLCSTTAFQKWEAEHRELLQA